MVEQSEKVKIVVTNVHRESTHIFLAAYLLVDTKNLEECQIKLSFQG